MRMFMLHWALVCAFFCGGNCYVFIQNGGLSPMGAAIFTGIVSVVLINVVYLSP